MGLALCAAISYIFNMIDHGAPGTRNKKRDNSCYLNLRERSISAPLLCDRHTLVARAIRWIIPWSRDTFPGLRAGIREVLGRPTIAWATVQGWRAGRSRISADDAERFAHFIRARSEHGLSIAGELEEYVAKRRAEPRRPRGFQVVRKRDGPGSIPRDGRNRRGRPKKRNRRWRPMKSIC
jgi:hypothetical protein